MTIAAGETILASDVQAIKDDVDAILSASSATVNTDETRSATTYGNPATAGPAVTVTTGTTALVLVTAAISNNTANAESFACAEVSGATTDAATDSRALAVRMTDTTAGTTKKTRATAAHLFTGLTAGSNTFTVKYRVDAGTGSFEHRNIVVIPIGD